MSASTLATFDGLLYEWQTKQLVEELMYPENPLLQMLQKNGDQGFVGDVFQSPLIVGNPQGRGKDFSTAQSNATNLLTDKWVISPGDYFSVVQIGEKVRQASRTNLGAALENKRAEIRGLIEEDGDALDLYCWGNGGGSLGVVASISGNDVTLTDPTQIGNFERNMTVQASTGDGTSTGHSVIAGSDTVDGINRGTGIVKFEDITDFTGTLAVGHHLFRASDFFGDSGGKVVDGVQSYVTATDAPPALNNIAAATRALDPQRYAGVRIPANILGSRTIEDRISLFLAMMGTRFKAKTKGLKAFMNGEDFHVLEKNMKARGQRDAVTSSTSFGFPTIEINSAAGKIPIISARHCPKGTMFFLRMQDWGLHYLGPDLMYQQTDELGGMKMLLKSDSTNWEYRRISFPVLVCNAPKNSGRLPV